MQFNCVKRNCTRNWTECSLVQHRFPISFFVSSVCLLVRVTVVDKNKAVVCCLLATSAIMLSEKKKRKSKMCSKKWHLKRNISCDVHMLNGLLETDVPWDDVIVVSIGEVRKLWDSLSEPRSSLCEWRLERTVLRPALLSSELRSFLSFFRQVWHYTVKSLSLRVFMALKAVIITSQQKQVYDMRRHVFVYF